MDQSNRDLVPYLKIGLVLTTATVLGLSLIRAPYPQDQALQHVPTVLALVFLAIAARKNWLTITAVFCLIAFIGLHILGARHLYSYVPYDDWATRFFGSSISEWFGWQRNHYDRFVHFAFGVLCMTPLYEWARRYGQLRRGWAILFALFALMTMSALYETIEWGIAVVMSPTQADSYNGQQGDFWDAQKDMALAFVGSLCVIPLLAICERKRQFDM